MSDLQAMPFFPGTARGILRRGLESAAPDTILILTQQDLSQFDGSPAGIVVIDGAPFSHPMIRVFGFGIPTVLVTAETAKMLEEGSEVIINGSIGSIKHQEEASTIELPDFETAMTGKPVTTSDGAEIELRTSISKVDGAIAAVKQGAAAIGLVRSEFLIPEDGRLPDAKFFEGALREFCDAAQPLSITVRLPDIASDKQTP